MAGDATLPALNKALESNDFHVFHFIGHGQFDESAGEGVLVLEDGRGRAKSVTGMTLGHILQDERTLQLAVLNACEGARTSTKDPFAGVAASLVKSEIPSVVAMQFEITDSAAIVFAEGFYSALARGSPVDAALSSARKAIWAESNDVEWGTPVLFMRVPDGRVFDVRLDSARSAELAEAEPELDVQLAADPTIAAEGDEIRWRLTITNAGQTPLSQIIAVSSDGSTLAAEDQLQPGRKSVRTWRSRPKEDHETSVTVSATSTSGDRIVEQVTAHVTIQLGVHQDDLPTALEEPIARASERERVRPEPLIAGKEAGLWPPQPVEQEHDEQPEPAPSVPERSDYYQTTWHDYKVAAVALGPDGRYVISGSLDGIARVWEMGSGREVAHMKHDLTAYRAIRREMAVAFSPDGRYVVSGSNDKTARVWEATGGQEVARMTHEGFVVAVAFSPDGRYVVSGSKDKTARVWETTSGREVARMTHNFYIDAVAFSPDGHYVASVSADGTARVWETTSGREVARMTHDDWARAIAFSPDGRYVVSGSDDKTARVWEATSGQEVARMTHEGWVKAIAFSPDGRYVVSGSRDKTARVWETTSGREVARMTHDGHVGAVAFSPDGRYVVSGSHDRTARVWETTSGREVERRTHGKQISALAFSPEGRYVLSGSHDKTVRVWEYHPIEPRVGPEEAAMTSELIRDGAIPAEWQGRRAYRFRITNIGGAHASDVDAWLVDLQGEVVSEESLEHSRIAGLLPLQSGEVAVVVKDDDRRRNPLHLKVTWFSRGETDGYHSKAPIPIK